MFLPRKGAGFKVSGTLMAWKTLSKLRWLDGKVSNWCIIASSFSFAVHQKITTRSFSTSLDFFSGIRFLLVIWNSPGTVEEPSKRIVFTTVCPFKKAFRNPKVHIYPFLFHWRKLFQPLQSDFVVPGSWHWSHNIPHVYLVLHIFWKVDVTIYQFLWGRFINFVFFHIFVNPSVFGFNSTAGLWYRFCAITLHRHGSGTMLWPLAVDGLELGRATWSWTHGGCGFSNYSVNRWWFHRFFKCSSLPG